MFKKNILLLNIMPGEIYYFTKRTELRDLVKKSKAIIVDFTATWCGPCKNAKPFLMEFFDNNKDRFDLVIVDVDKGSDICSAMKVKSYPTFLSFIHGELTSAQIGFDELQMQGFFNKTLYKLNNYGRF